MQKLVETVLSIGFLKWLWDGVIFLWRHFYTHRVTIDFYIAYRPVRTGMPLEKSAFLVVRNGTSRDVTIDMFLGDTSRLLRRFRLRKTPRMQPKPIVKIPANKAMQCALAYRRENVINPHLATFGVRLTNGSAVWLSNRKWNRLLREFKTDFPDWESHRRSQGTPLEFKQYQPDYNLGRSAHDL